MTLRVVLLLALLASPSSLLAIPDPPLIVRLSKPGIAQLPDGSEIALPAGTEIPACSNTPLTYDPASQVAFVNTPCLPIFKNGFE